MSLYNLVYLTFGISDNQVNRGKYRNVGKSIYRTYIQECALIIILGMA